MVEDVFLLGAGFSKGVSAHMPLMDELGRISFRIHDSYGAATSGRSFEQLLTFLSQNQPWLTEYQNLQNRATFLELSGKIATRLHVLEARALSEPIPAWLEAFFSRLHESRAWVVTLNYDTLLEHAFTEMLRKSDPTLNAVMSHASIYAVPIQGALARTRLTNNPFQGTETLRLVKLHGSLNWCYSGSELASGEEIYDTGVVPGWRPDALPLDVKAAAIDKVPLVIPPTLGKSPFFANETIRSMWRVGFMSLEKAPRVYALGYSLPESDHNMIGLLRHALGEGQTLHVVDVDSDVGERYAELLAPDTGVDTTFSGTGVEQFAIEYVASDPSG